MQRVAVDAPEQVEVRKIKDDVARTLEDLLDEECFDDECAEPLFDAQAFRELPPGATREDYQLSAAAIERVENVVAAVRQRALDAAAELQQMEVADVLHANAADEQAAAALLLRDGDDADADLDVGRGKYAGMQVAGELRAAFAKYRDRARDDDPQPEDPSGKAARQHAKKSLCELSSADVAAVVDGEKGELLSHEAIARRHDISAALVGRIVRAARKDKDYVSKRERKELEKAELTDAVARLVGGWDEDVDGMLSAGRLRKKLRDDADLDCSTTTLRLILRRGLGLRFKKIKQLAPQTNSLKNVVCRQRYALAMLDALAGGRRVINVDESWLNTMAFKRHAWTKKGRAAARPTKELSTRASFIAAIDNRGAAYISLGTANTDAAVMAAFFAELCKVLDAEDANWREETVVLLDNAAYHRSPEARAAVKKLGIPVIFSGPYSYISAPIELYFGLLKRGDLNPERQQLGKR